ncbi:MAG: cation diffusion facilitator family transporter [Lactobacillaceae bacterium]|jgi:cation diffusion facilitator family transporter|nr:cation diffusion facilitator family transporter [Lactobacillaceae bacterium]
MNEIDRHFAEEKTNWQQAEAAELQKLNSASQHLYLNVAAYLSIAVAEYWLAIVGHSQTLRADALNNLSGIISTVLLLIGIHIARDVDDDDIAGKKLPTPISNSDGAEQRITFTRFRYQTIFTLVTGIIMIGIAGNVIYTGIQALLNAGEKTIPKPITIYGAAIASIIMLVVWYLNRRAGRKLQNAAVIASAQDSLSDAFTSIGTLLSIIGAILWQVTWLDGVTSILVGLFILYSGIRIFSSSSLQLADYFDPVAEQQFHDFIEAVPAVYDVRELKAHYDGNVITLDVTITVDAQMTVLESYQLAEKIERLLQLKYGIIDTDVVTVPESSTIK